MPSGLFVGPENRSRTERDERTRLVNSGVGCRGSPETSSRSIGFAEGRPGGWLSPGSGDCATASESL
eukprot:2880578-Pleurochrysis_carterae.AAC.1